MGLKLNQDTPTPALTPLGGGELSLNPADSQPAQVPLSGLSLNINPTDGEIEPNAPLPGMLLDLDCECVTSGPAIYLTSHPYPLEAMDAMGISFGPTRSQDAPMAEDGMGVAFYVVNAGLRDLVRSYDMQPDAMETGFSFVSASIRNMVHVYTASPDGAQIGFSCLSATLRSRVITYAMQPDGMNVGFSLVSATLQ